MTYVMTIFFYCCTSFVVLLGTVRIIKLVRLEVDLAAQVADAAGFFFFFCLISLLKA